MKGVPRMRPYIYKVLLTNLKRVWIFFMILTPLMAALSWFAVILPHLNYTVYYLNLFSVFSFPFVAILAIKYSWHNYDHNRLACSALIAMAPAINVAITIFCFNHMQLSA